MATDAAPAPAAAPAAAILITPSPVRTLHTSTASPVACAAATPTQLDVLACPKCHGRMKLVALIKEPKSITRYLTALGEPTDVPIRSPSRGPPYWKSTFLRKKALGEVA